MSYQVRPRTSSQEQPGLVALAADHAYYAGDVSRIFDGCTSKSSSAAQQAGID